MQGNFKRLDDSIHNNLGIKISFDQGIKYLQKIIFCINDYLNEFHNPVNLLSCTKILLSVI